MMADLLTKMCVVSAGMKKAIPCPSVRASWHKVGIKSLIMYLKGRERQIVLKSRIPKLEPQSTTGLQDSLVLWEWST